jgi:hypothetical protein
VDGEEFVQMDPVIAMDIGLGTMITCRNSRRHHLLLARAFSELGLARGAFSECVRAGNVSQTTEQLREAQVLAEREEAFFATKLWTSSAIV